MQVVCRSELRKNAIEKRAYVTLFGHLTQSTPFCHSPFRAPLSLHSLHSTCSPVFSDSESLLFRPIHPCLVTPNTRCSFRPARCQRGGLAAGPGLRVGGVKVRRTPLHAVKEGGQTLEPHKNRFKVPLGKPRIPHHSPDAALLELLRPLREWTLVQSSHAPC